MKHNNSDRSLHATVGPMAKKSRTDLRALRNMIDEANLLLTTTELPEGRSRRACELLGTALKLADHLLTESPAVTLGKLGGQKIALREDRTTSENSRQSARRGLAEGHAKSNSF